MAPPPPHADPRPADASEQAAEDSDGLGAAAHVLGTTDLAHAITSHVAEGDLLCWALACPGFLAAARQIRPGLWSEEGRITAPASFSPERLRWFVAGHVASVVEGRFGADTELQAEDLAIVKSAVRRALYRRGVLLQRHSQLSGPAAAAAASAADEVTGRAVFEAVVAAMWAHGGSAEAQERGCHAFASAWVHMRACHNPADDSPTIRDRAAEAGAVEAVVAAMRAHGDSAEVQASSCRALRNLVYDSPANRAYAAEAGAVEAVVAAIRALEGNEYLQVVSCFALAALAVDSPANQDRAAEAGAVKAVVAAMLAHEGSAGVQEMACAALATLVILSPANQARAGEAGALGAVVAAMRAHGDSAMVQKYGPIWLGILGQHHD